MDVFNYPLLVVTRGLPGSGKTTWAKMVMASHHNACGRANRDDIRRSVFADVASSMGYRFYKSQEKLVTQIQDRIIEAVLCSGKHVIVDDTTLPWIRYSRFEKLALNNLAELVIVNFDADAETCIQRQEGRPSEEQVPTSVILKMSGVRTKENEAKWIATGKVVPAHSVDW